MYVEDRKRETPCQINDLRCLGACPVDKTIVTFLDEGFYENFSSHWRRMATSCSSWDMEAQGMEMVVPTLAT